MKSGVFTLRIMYEIKKAILVLCKGVKYGLTVMGYVRVLSPTYCSCSNTHDPTYADHNAFDLGRGGRARESLRGGANRWNFSRL